ncbi:translation initiation factor IF-2 [[Mycoplasma] testudinis]|uniref:translation initiation factor IF-2 n=1 Tax=[Mycoplasma] testudinis TaxID=33924 RepID=UPI000489AFEE|nr:translation initiation factor IF-2 [[Mycoplasma] testudinis]
MAKTGNHQKQRNKRPNQRNDKRDGISLQSHFKKVTTGVQNGVFVYTGPLSLSAFSEKIGQPSSGLIKHFFLKGKIVNLNTMLSIEQIGELCLEYNMDFRMETEINEENILDAIKFDDDPSKLMARPPIVTIMGHVDHGKTSLLDAIRKTNVVSGEHGGITQHIGAYQVALDGKPITFIDTPGHEAFTSMRARGADVTDIVVLVVAADDGIKPQTEEAIDHAKNANVPIIVFINKIDKPEANADRVMQQMSKYDLVPEAWGGDTIVVSGSAFTKEGITELLHSILLLAEINKYEANYNCQPYGVVIEANLAPGLGPLASVIINRGTLKVGDYIALGAACGRVRTMQDENGKDVIEATPAKPVKISGFDIVPEVGEKFIGSANESEIKNIAASYKQKMQRQKHESLSATIQLRERVENNEVKSLDMILKTDAQGSLEAIKQAVGLIEVEGACTNVIRAGTGAISETDVKLAQASKAIIFGFNMAIPKAIKEMADSVGVIIRSYDIIYNMLRDVQDLLKGQLDPVYEDIELGELTVREIWKHSKIGTIAGCYITSGKVKRNANCRIIRDGAVIYRSKIDSLKSFKEFVSELDQGHECGVTITNFNDLKAGDVIQVFETIVQEQ